MDIPRFLAWMHHGEGVWWLPRLRAKWQIEAAAERARRDGDATEAEARVPKHWRGGRCDPAETTIWADDGAEAA